MAHRTPRTALLSVGMLVVGLGFSGWYMARTVLDTSRTERIVHTVLADETVRSFVAGKVEPVLARNAPTAAAAVAAQAGSEVAPGASAEAGPLQAGPMQAGVVQAELSRVLADPAIQTELEQFVGDLHRRVIGEGSGPVTLDKTAVDRMVTAVVPSIGPAELTQIPAVTFTPPQTGAINAVRTGLADNWWWIGLIGIAIVVTAVVISDDRRRCVRVIGVWLIGLSLVQLAVLWFVPVYVVPAVTDNVWARVVSKVADAVNGGLVVGLVVIAALGVLLVFSNALWPDRGAGGALRRP